MLALLERRETAAERKQHGRQVRGTDVIARVTLHPLPECGEVCNEPEGRLAKEAAEA